MEADKKNVLIVRVDLNTGVDHIALRNCILESIQLGVLILGMDDTLEVIELPPLGGVEVRDAAETGRPAAETQQSPEPEPAEDTPPPRPDHIEEKREILQRLKDYRAANGLGSLEKLSAKTAHQKGRRRSAETLRYLCADGAPKMPIEDWRKISRALELMKKEAQNESG